MLMQSIERNFNYMRKKIVLINNDVLGFEVKSH